MSAAPSPETETIRIVTEVEIAYEGEGSRDHAIASALDRISIDFMGGMRGSSYTAKSIKSELQQPLHVDEDGEPVTDGDTITFSYGIPPVGVRGEVGWLNGELWVFTPGHNPPRCELAKLREYVGLFYKA